MIASQVDLAPTILALNGLTPRVAPFLGRDISCSLVVDCLADNVAYLSSVYDDLIALADRGGILLYLRRTKLSYQTNLAFTAPTKEARESRALGLGRLLALHESTNWILDQNRIWSWKELGGEL